MIMFWEGAQRRTEAVGTNSRGEWLKLILLRLTSGVLSLSFCLMNMKPGHILSSECVPPVCLSGSF